MARGTHLVHLWPEGTSLDVQVHLDDLDIIHLRADAVHAVRGRADEDAIFAGDARDAEQEVDAFVRTDAEEEVVLAGDVAQLAEASLDVEVPGRGIPVEIEVVERGCIAQRKVRSVG